MKIHPVINYTLFNNGTHVCNTLQYPFMILRLQGIASDNKYPVLDHNAKSL